MPPPIQVSSQEVANDEFALQSVKLLLQSGAAKVRAGGAVSDAAVPLGTAGGGP